MFLLKKKVNTRMILSNQRTPCAVTFSGCVVGGRWVPQWPG